MKKKLVNKILNIVYAKPPETITVRKTILTEYRLCRNLRGFRLAENIPYPEKPEGLFLIKVVNYTIEFYRPYFLLRELVMDLEMTRQLFELKGLRIIRRWQYGFTVEVFENEQSEKTKIA